MLEKRQLGDTPLYVHRIGISTSFGAGEEIYDEAFERGCNYFTWGTFIKGRNKPFKRFVNRLEKSGKREQLVLGLLSYSHSAFLGDIFLHSALKQLGTDYIDSLILGYFSQRPPQRLLDWAMELKERGLVRAVGITSHNRKVVAGLAQEGCVDYSHFRYNAVHSGAEQDIFPQIQGSNFGLVSFTATSWGQLMARKKMATGVEPASAGDCYRFVLARDEIDCCMMGVKNSAMLRENFSILDKGPMSGEELRRMRDIGDHLYGRKRHVVQ